MLTHHPRPTFTLSDTTFHFVDASAQDALAMAFDAADGKDVRIGGGVATVREFLAADLIDTMHVAVAPLELGSGERLWESPDELTDRFHLETHPEPERGDASLLLAPLRSVTRTGDLRSTQTGTSR